MNLKEDPRFKADLSNKSGDSVANLTICCLSQPDSRIWASEQLFSSWLHSYLNFRAYDFFSPDIVRYRRSRAFC